MRDDVAWQEGERPSVTELEDRAFELRSKLLHLCGTYEGAVHIGGDLSAADIFTALFHYGLRVDPHDISNPHRDRFLLSKGHAAVCMYIAMSMRGFFSYDGIVETYGKLDSAYGMHPCKVQLPGVEASTGSLGHGLPIAVGMALSGRYRGDAHRVVCLLGDGSFQFGLPALWTAARSGIPVTFVVLNNRTYSAVASALSRFGGAAAEQDRWPGTDIAGLDIAAAARAFGVPAERVPGVADLPRALSAALATSGPAVVEVLTGPSAPSAPSPSTQTAVDPAAAPEGGGQAW